MDSFERLCSMIMKREENKYNLSLLCARPGFDSWRMLLQTCDRVGQEGPVLYILTYMEAEEMNEEFKYMECRNIPVMCEMREEWDSKKIEKIIAEIKPVLVAVDSLDNNETWDRMKTINRIFSLPVVATYTLTEKCQTIEDFISNLEDYGMVEIYHDIPKIFCMNKVSEFYLPDKYRAFKESGIITVDKLESKGGKISIPFVYDHQNFRYLSAYDLLRKSILTDIDRSIKEVSDMRTVFYRELVRSYYMEQYHALRECGEFDPENCSEQELENIIYSEVPMMPTDPGYMEEYGYLMMYDIFPTLYRKIIEIVKAKRGKNVEKKVRQLLEDIRYIRERRLEPIKKILNEIESEVDYCADILSCHETDH